VTHFCPSCWRTIRVSERQCRRCGADLAVLDQRGFTEKLRAALRHPEPTVQQRAVYALGERGELQAAGSLGDLLTSTRDQVLAADIAMALANIGGHDAEVLLLRALEHRSFLVRLAAVQGLARTSDGLAAVALERAARDPSPSVRRLGRELEEQRRVESC